MDAAEEVGVGLRRNISDRELGVRYKGVVRVEEKFDEQNFHVVSYGLFYEKIKSTQNYMFSRQN